MVAGRGGGTNTLKGHWNWIVAVYATLSRMLFNLCVFGMYSICISHPSLPHCLCRCVSTTWTRSPKKLNSGEGLEGCCCIVADLLLD